MERELDDQVDAADRPDKEDGARGPSSRRRLATAVGLGLGVIALIALAAWLTFFRTDSTSSLMDMQGGVMGPSVCRLLPTEAIEQATGHLYAAHGAITRGESTTCLWERAADGSRFVDATFSMGADATSLEHQAATLAASYPARGSQPGATMRAVPDLGGQAYAVFPPIGGVALFVRRGSDSLLLVGTEGLEPMVKVAEQVLPSL
jgi:drug/metabolite transporter superfamily protein YnfA